MMIKKLVHFVVLQGSWAILGSIGISVLFSLNGLAAEEQMHMNHGVLLQGDAGVLLNSVEVILGVLSAFMSFYAAKAYAGGKLGKGMLLIAVGMTVMSVGHLLMVIHRLTGVDPLIIFGEAGSRVAFSLAVFISFICSGTGFYTIAKISKA